MKALPNQNMFYIAYSAKKDVYVYACDVIPFFIHENAWWLQQYVSYCGTLAINV